MALGNSNSGNRSIGCRSLLLEKEKVAKPIESLSDCRWLAELETEGLSSIAKERLLDVCRLGVGLGGGLFGEQPKTKNCTIYDVI